MVVLLWVSKFAMAEIECNFEMGILKWFILGIFINPSTHEFSFPMFFFVLESVDDRSLS